VKTNFFQPQVKCFARTVETLIKTNYMFLCTAEHSYPTFLCLLVYFRIWC